MKISRKNGLALALIVFGVMLLGGLYLNHQQALKLGKDSFFDFSYHKKK